MNFTDDRNAWWELEHEFASHMTPYKPDQTPVEDAYAEAFYEWVLEYGRGLDQDDFVELVRAVKPELLKMVEVSDEN